MTNIERILDELKYEREHESRHFANMNQLISDLEVAIDDIEEEKSECINLTLCKEGLGSLDHNCVYQTLMIHRGFVMDNDIKWHHKDDFPLRDKDNLCLYEGNGVDYVHVHGQCNQKDVEKEVYKFLR